MNVEWVLKPFDNLVLSELYAILALRQDVFIIEQDCIYEDLDRKDQRAHHLMGLFDGKLVAYARLFAPNDYYEKHCSFGRVATALDYRGRGQGRVLVENCIAQCQKNWPGTTIEISGQEYLNAFYCSLGFSSCSDLYLEDGIDHRRFQLAPKG